MGGSEMDLEILTNINKVYQFVAENKEFSIFVALTSLETVTGYILNRYKWQIGELEFGLIDKILEKTLKI